LASIPAPAKPSPIAPPGKPSQFIVKLNQEGSLELKWKCPNPAGAVGTMYHLHRRTEAGGALVYLGTSGERRFVDATLPPGSSQVTYQIQAFRSTSVGPAAQFNVNLGVDAGMQKLASSTAKVTTKMARIAA
jgi:hypothetical protein